MSGRIWFGRVGGEFLGDAEDGSPVLGHDDGVEQMTELSDFIAVENPFTIKRRDFIRRSRIDVACDICGTTTRYVDIDDADMYEHDETHCHTHQEDA